MHRIEMQEEVTHSHIALTLRNAGAMVLGKKPKGTGRRSWLFAHYQRTQLRNVMRWHCFNCYICQLTPHEYQLFRNAHHDELASEQGALQAKTAVARLDALYHHVGEASS